MKTKKVRKGHTYCGPDYAVLYRNAARKLYADPSDDDIEIDPGAVVSESESGAFVAAWVWVSCTDIGLPEPEMP